jgi:hypothetical protein
MLLQGGGVLINDATVTFINTQIHDNQAYTVRLARDLNLSRNVLPSPRCGKFPGTFFADLLLQGGGVYIEGSSTVKFEDCGIYSNSAPHVRSKHLNCFPELSSIAPLRVVSWN